MAGFPAPGITALSRFIRAILRRQFRGGIAGVQCRVLALPEETQRALDAWAAADREARRIEGQARAQSAARQPNAAAVALEALQRRQVANRLRDAAFLALDRSSSGGPQPAQGKRPPSRSIHTGA